MSESEAALQTTDSTRSVGTWRGLDLGVGFELVPFRLESPEMRVFAIRIYRDALVS